jgi:predicted RNA binding protein YcfA (HicA-like mRNA interferase family)
MSNHELFHDVRLKLLGNGFEHIKGKGKGDHHQFCKEGLKITVPYALRDRNMRKKILKQAGIEPK